MAKKLEKYLIYDFETTNLPKEMSAVFEGSKVKFENGKAVTQVNGVDIDKVGIHQLSGYVITVSDGVPTIAEEFDYHIKPFEDAIISDESLSIAGITREDLESYKPEHEVFQEFINMLLKYVDVYDKADKFTLVGYNNAKFDDNLLFWFFLRNTANGRHYYKGNFFYKGITIDILEIYSALAGPYRQFMENFKLSSVSAMFLPPDNDENYHNAAYDTKVTKDLFLEFYPYMRQFREEHKQIILKQLTPKKNV